MTIHLEKDAMDALEAAALQSKPTATASSMTDLVRTFLAKGHRDPARYTFEGHKFRDVFTADLLLPPLDHAHTSATLAQNAMQMVSVLTALVNAPDFNCLLYTSPSPRD